jgi:hypothetical protein
VSAAEIIETVKALNALPHGSYVRGYDGFGHVKHLDHWILTAGSGHQHDVDSIELPARVLWVPDDQHERSDSADG